MSNNPTIVYTLTDEAPYLATHSLLPIIKRFVSQAGVDIVAKDISLAARILAAFPDYLNPEQRVSDDLRELGLMVNKPDANIIKLPNISASIAQLKKAIEELQAGGYDLPDYPDTPSNDVEKDVKLRYDKIKGSAVNPVLREGNSDRRAPKPVKNYARKFPHRMGAWSKDSKTHVATMSAGDFRNTEKSITLDEATVVDIIWKGDGDSRILKKGLSLESGEIIDAAIMRKSALTAFFSKQISEAKEQDVLFSLHVKATMMKVSDPIIFGHAVKTYFKEDYDRYGEELEQAGANANAGWNDVLTAINTLDNAEEIKASVQTHAAAAPALAMVNSEKGISNLHFPNDVIIDASMAAMIRNSGKMWDSNGETQDTKAVIPDSSYAGLYQRTIDFHKEHGAFDPSTMGSVSNIGLMAKKAEEYGSHDKTFEIHADGKVEVVDAAGNVLLQHTVEEGDIWRMCQVKDLPIRNWVELAVKRARETGNPAIFWLSEDRSHDAEVIKKVRQYLQDHDTEGLDIQIQSVEDATTYTLERVKKGLDTISVTGNVLRDYLTDLFPILELGTSAKMLSIVPLLEGGGLFETGAGGSAPKHVNQFVDENHLRWDSLGEFLALAVSLDHLATKYNNDKAAVLAETLDAATNRHLDENKSPSRKVMEIDNRGSHFYLALYWAQELAKQDRDPELKEHFAAMAQALTDNEASIAQGLIEVQGVTQDIGGYYLPKSKKITRAMRPSVVLNTIIDA